jgi:putative hydrolase of the HAD superfamily
MIGNSLKSDVMPVLAIGGHAAHVPYHTTWVHERIEHTIEHPWFYEIGNVADITSYLGVE